MELILDSSEDISKALINIYIFFFIRENAFNFLTYKAWVMISFLWVIMSMREFPELSTLFRQG